MEKFLKKEIELLPQEARKLLGEFCEFLLLKYENKIDKTKELKKLFMKPKGKLPNNYQFNREEAHE